MRSLKHFVSENLWICKNLIPFFMAFISIAIVVLTLMSGLFLINAQPTSGTVIDSEFYKTERDGQSYEKTILTVSYTLDDKMSTGTFSENGHSISKVGDQVAILVSGTIVQPDGWGNLFGVPIVLLIMLCFLGGLYKLINVKYDPDSPDAQEIK